jgi:hypothetical protein
MELTVKRLFRWPRSRWRFSAFSAGGPIKIDKDGVSESLLGVLSKAVRFEALTGRR